MISLNPGSDFPKVFHTSKTRLYKRGVIRDSYRTRTRRPAKNAVLYIIDSYFQYLVRRIDPNPPLFFFISRIVIILNISYPTWKPYAALHLTMTAEFYALPESPRPRGDRFAGLQGTPTFDIKPKPISTGPLQDVAPTPVDHLQVRANMLVLVGQSDLSQDEGLVVQSDRPHPS
jgi:hypothetical protein